MTSIPSRATLRRRAAEEFKEFLVVAAYLFVCFAALINMKAAILHAQGVNFSPYSIAVVKALLCAKFMSLGNVLRLGRRFHHHGLIWITLYKSFVFFALLLALNAIEEIVMGLIHHRSVAEFDPRCCRRHAGSTHCRELRHAPDPRSVLRISFARRGRRRSQSRTRFSAFAAEGVIAGRCDLDDADERPLRCRIDLNLCAVRNRLGDIDIEPRNHGEIGQRRALHHDRIDAV